MLNITQLVKDYEKNSYRLKSQLLKMKYDDLLSMYLEINEYKLKYIDKKTKENIISGIFTNLKKILTNMY